VRALFDTNDFGMLHVIKTVLPFLRQQGSGHCVGVASTLASLQCHLSVFTVRTSGRLRHCMRALHRRLRSSESRLPWLSGRLCRAIWKARIIVHSEGMEAYGPLRQLAAEIDILVKPIFLNSFQQLSTSESKSHANRTPRKGSCERPPSLTSSLRQRRGSTSPRDESGLKTRPSHGVEHRRPTFNQTRIGEEPARDSIRNALDS